MENFASDQISQMRKIFDYFDSTKSGDINVTELETMMNELGRGMTSEEAQILLVELDSDGNGVIDFDEFVVGLGNFFFGGGQKKNQDESNCSISKDEKKATDGVNDDDDVENEALDKQIRTFFDHVDTDGSGTIDLDELKQIMTEMGKDPSEADDLMDLLDVDKKGELGFTVFSQYFRQFFKTHKEPVDEEKERLKRIKAVFDHVDVDGSGTIDVDELKQVMQELGRDPSEAEKLMNLLDKEGDGELDFQTFAAGFSKFTGEEEEEKLRQIKEIFSHVDTDGSGTIDLDELKQVMKEMGREEKEAVKLMKLLDKDGSGELDFETFSKGFAQFTQEEDEEQKSSLHGQFSPEQMQQFAELFAHIDVDGSGAIDIEEMRSALKELGKSVTDKQLEKLFQDLDEDGSGELEFDEFVEGIQLLDKLASIADTFDSEEKGKSGQNEELLQDVTRLKECNLDLQLKLDAIQSQISYYESNHRKLQSELEKKTAELETFRKKRDAALKDSNWEISRELEEIKEELTKARRTEKLLKKKNSDMKKAVDSQQMNVDILTSTNEENDKEICRLRSELKHFEKANYKEQVMELSVKICELEEKEASAKKSKIDMASIVDAIHQKDKEISEVKALWEEDRIKLEELTNQMDEGSLAGELAQENLGDVMDGAKVQDLEKDLRKEQAHKKKIEELCQQKENEIQKAIVKQKQIEEKIITVLEEAEKTKVEFQGKTDELLKKSAGLQKDVDKERNDHAETKERLKGDISQLQSSFEKEKLQTVHLQSLIEELEKRIEKETTEKVEIQNKLQKEVEELFKKTNDLQKEAERNQLDHKKTKEILENDISKIKSSLEEETKTKDQLQKLSEELKVKIEAASIDNNEKQSELQQIIDELHLQKNELEKEKVLHIETNGKLESNLKNECEAKVEMQTISEELKNKLGKETEKKVEFQNLLEKEKEARKIEKDALDVEISNLVDEIKDKKEKYISEMGQLKSEMESIISEKEKEKESLLDKIRQQTEETGNLNKTISELKNMSESSQTELSKEIQLLKQNVSQLQSKNETESVAAKHEKDMLEKNLKSLTDELSKERESFRSAAIISENQKDSADGEILKLKGDIHNEKEDRKKDQMAFETRIKEQSNEIETIQKEKQTLADKLVEEMNQRKSAQTKLENVGHQLDTLSKAHEELNICHDNSVEEVESLKKMIEKEKSAHKETSNKLNEVTQCTEDLTSKNENLMKEIDRLKKLLDNEKESHQNTSSKLEEITKRYSELHDKYKAVLEDNEKSKILLQNEREEKQTLEMNLNEKASKLEESLKEIDGLQKRISDIEGENEKISFQYKNECTSHQEDLDKLKKSEELLNSKDEELNKLHETLGDTRKAKEDEEKRKRELENELEAAKASLADFSKMKEQNLEDEDFAYIEYVNFLLEGDEHIADRIPIGRSFSDVATACLDGLVFCKLMNKAVSGTVDERVIKYRPKNKQELVENHNLTVNSAISIGCAGASMMKQAFFDGNVPALLTLMAEIIKIGLLNRVSVGAHKELICLKESSEDVKTFLRLVPEQLLMRWINYHLKAGGHSNMIKNFSDDLKDSVKFLVLMHQLDSSLDMSAVGESDLLKRAENVIQNAEKMKLRKFLSPSLIVKGNPKLNLLFIAYIFDNKPCLKALKDEDNKSISKELLDFDAAGTREERAFCNWIMSLGIPVRDIVEDLRNGIYLLQVFDKIKEKLVDWKKVSSNVKRINRFQMAENCNYAIRLGKEMNFSLVGIGGQDFVDGNRKLLLATIWQLMRYHIFSILKNLKFGGKDVSEDDMISWANKKVKTLGHSRQMKDFRDKSLADSLFFLDLLHSIDPNAVDYDYVANGSTADGRMNNAKYAINVARKLGCCIFLLWEDIVEVNSKMLLTFVGTLMSVEQ